MFMKSPRAKAFVSRLLEVCSDWIVNFMIVGTVVILDMMSIFEGDDIFDKRKPRHHRALKTNQI